METRYQGVGRRKTSVARVILKEGKGEITINGRSVKEYLKIDYFINRLYEPFKILNAEGKFDCIIKVEGGGLTGQADACVLGISRCLAQVDPSYRRVLRQEGFLTRDPRMVERKKYGLKKARKSFQFSKR